MLEGTLELEALTKSLGLKMNERIKELSLRASHAAHEALKAKEYSADKPWQYIYADKFAKLIVKECANVCTDYTDKSHRDYEPVREQCAIEIKEYFGVSE